MIAVHVNYLIINSFNFYYKYIFAQTLAKKRTTCSPVFNRALSILSMFPKGLFRRGLNIQRAIFLLVCTIGKQGLLIPLILIAQYSDSSADNVLPAHPSESNKVFFLVTLPIY